VSKATLHIAWTADDGPTSFTSDMLSVFNKTLNKPIPVTWYVQWDNLVINKRHGFYKNLQDKHKHEIAIHGVSTIANHIHWFPTNNKKHASYASIEEATTAISSFKNHLIEHGMRAKFVRAPTGLHSELMAYLSKLGVANNRAD